VQAQVMLAIQTKKADFTYRDIAYTVSEEGENFYSIYSDGELVGIAYKDIVSSSVEGKKLSFEFIFSALKAYTSDTSKGDSSFSADGTEYLISDLGYISDASGNEVAYISRYVVQAIMGDIFLSRDFKEKLIETIMTGGTEFSYTDESLIIAEDEEPSLEEDEANILATDDITEDEAPVSATAEYTIRPNQNHKGWSIRQLQSSRQYDTYASPSKSHWLGTDRYGMDMLTRLMYGGRVSLLIGFIVVIIETLLGVIMGGISGYFGGWVDNLIMRLVDIFYCIPSMPIIIILGAAMDAQRVDPSVRMVYLMLILGILGWAGIARLVRGQILSLREQEFMTATEASGLSVTSRIFKHLIPNVIPQLIVNCTMSLGGVIITEATLSFLGLGVKFPFASWGNIINDVNNTHVLTTYWFIWIPAGTLLLLTVLAFNLVGDGLRDAFDPRMNR
jgi:peptide/nickel transport system permease protein